VIKIDIPATLREFLDQGSAYLAAPDIMKALQLDDASARLLDVAGHYLKDEQLAGKIFAFRQAFREQQLDRMQTLFSEIEAILTQRLAQE